MDFARISKAIGAGIGGVVATEGASGIVYFNLPSTSVVPQAVLTAVPIINAIIGFALGFVGAYFAPANSAPKKKG